MNDTEDFDGRRARMNEPDTQPDYFQTAAKIVRDDAAQRLAKTATCHICGKPDIPLDNDGKMKEHYVSTLVRKEPGSTTTDHDWCPASGSTPIVPEPAQQQEETPICTCKHGSVGAVECKIHNPQPDWEYSPYRAALRYRGLIWAIVTNDGKNPIPEGDAEMLVEMLNTYRDQERSLTSALSRITILTQDELYWRDGYDAMTKERDALRTKVAELEETSLRWFRTASEITGQRDTLQSKLDEAGKDSALLDKLSLQDVLTLDYITSDGNAVNMMIDPCQRTQCEPSLRHALAAISTTPEANT